MLRATGGADGCGVVVLCGQGAVIVRPEAGWWLEAGERDLRMALELRRADLYEGTAFHCQQASEKLLKGLFLRRQAIWRRTHSCVDLLEELAEAGVHVPGGVATAGRRLDLHYVDARYPNGVGGPPEKFYDATIADQALAEAEIIRSFVRTHFDDPPPKKS